MSGNVLPVRVKVGSVPVNKRYVTRYFVYVINDKGEIADLRYADVRPMKKEWFKSRGYVYGYFDFELPSGYIIVQGERDPDGNVRYRFLDSSGNELDAVRYEEVVADGLVERGFIVGGLKIPISFTMEYSGGVLKRFLLSRAGSPKPIDHLRKEIVNELLREAKRLDTLNKYRQAVIALKFPLSEDVWVAVITGNTYPVRAKAKEAGLRFSREVSEAVGYWLMKNKGYSKVDAFAVASLRFGMALTEWLLGSGFVDDFFPDLKERYAFIYGVFRKLYGEAQEKLTPTEALMAFATSNTLLLQDVVRRVLPMENGRMKIKMRQTKIINCDTPDCPETPPTFEVVAMASMDFEGTELYYAIIRAKTETVVWLPIYSVIGWYVVGDSENVDTALSKFKKKITDTKIFEYETQY